MRVFVCPKRAVFAVLAVCVAGLATASVLPGPAGFADPPPSLDEVAAQVVTLQTQAEQASEAYNGAHLALDEAQQGLDAATAEVAEAQQRLLAAQAAIGSTVAAAYRSGASEQLLNLVTTDNPRTLLDRAGALAKLGRSEGNQVEAAELASQGVRRARAAMADGVAASRRLDGELGARKAQVDQALQQQQALLDRLGDEQLAQFADAQARAEATASERSSRSAPRQPLPAAGGSAPSSAAAAAVAAAYAQLGKPYVWGAAGPGSFDCSGLTQFVWGQAGRSLGHFTGAQWNSGQHVPRGQERPGDLVFFGSDLHHMGIYVGDGKMINAPHTGDVVRIADAFRAGYQGAVRP